MFVIVFASLAVLGFAVHVTFFDRPETPARWLEIALLWLFGVVVG